MLYGNFWEAVNGKRDWQKDMSHQEWQVCVTKEGYVDLSYW